MPLVRWPLRALAALLLLAAPLPARATTVVRQSLQGLTDRSDLVVRGVVERVEVRAPQGAPPFQLVFVRVTEDPLGRAPARVPVRLPGGVSAEGLDVAVAGTPSLKEGDDVLLFLTRVPEAATARPTVAPPRGGRGGVGVPAGGPQPAQQWQPIALSLGTWRVADVEGEPTASPDPAARGMHQVGDEGPGLPARARVRDLLDAVRARKAVGR